MVLSLIEAEILEYLGISICSSLYKDRTTYTFYRIRNGDVLITDLSEDQAQAVLNIIMEVTEL